MKSLCIAILLVIIALILVKPDEFVAARTATHDAAASTLQAAKKLATEIEQRAANN